MNYWVIKGSVRGNDWSQLKKGESWNWWTSRLASRLQTNDRAFFWKSYPETRIVGLAEVTNPRLRVARDGRTTYRLKCLTGQFLSGPGIGELRQTAELKDASFLKAGAAMCIFPLNSSQAETLFTVIIRYVPEVALVWPELSNARTTEMGEIESWEEMAAEEGSKRLVAHIRRERNPKLVAAKKAQVLTRTGRLICEVCAFDFHQVYGELGREFCEVHHTEPLGGTNESRPTRLSELAIVCANCHRMLHRSDPLLSVAELHEALAKTSTTALRKPSIKFSKRRLALNPTSDIER